MVSQMSVCPRCGEPVRAPDQALCARCGAALAPAAQPGYAAAPYPAAPYSAGGSRRRPVLLLVVGVLILAVVGAGALFLYSMVSKPSGPASTYVFQLQVPAGQSISASALDTTVAILEQRMGALGVSGSAKAAPPNEVSITAYGADPNVIALLSQAGNLEFVLLPPDQYGTATQTDCPSQPNQTCKPVPMKGDPIDPSLPAQFFGRDLDPSGVSAVLDVSQADAWEVDFRFNSGAAAQFAAWSGAHVNDYFAIVLDGAVQSAPYIESAITGGAGRISGAFSQAEAKSLAAVLRYGALPYPLSLISQNVPAR